MYSGLITGSAAGKSSFLTPYHPQLDLWDRELESELLAAITDFWDVEGMMPRSAVSTLLDRF